MSNANYEKITILPLEGDSKGKGIPSMYNPNELSFTKSVGWSDDSVGCETDYPALQFTAGQAITLSVELFFDKYEQAGDVRDEVTRLIHLCEIQEISGSEKRPPRVQLVWGDANPLVKGKTFAGVIESAQAKYTMFLNNGTPCRASVTVSIKQADVVGTQTQTFDSEGNAKSVRTYTVNSAAELSNIPGGYQQVIKDGKDPSSISYPYQLVISDDSKSEE